VGGFLHPALGQKNEALREAGVEGFEYVFARADPREHNATRVSPAAPAPKLPLDQ
jgi:hypothetical protein